MKNPLVIASLAGLAFTAITNSYWSWLVAVIGLAAVFYVGRRTRLTTRLQLMFVGTLGAGLGAEIIRTIFFTTSGTAADGGMYRQVLIVSLGSVVIVLSAMIAEHLLKRLLSRPE